MISVFIHRVNSIITYVRGGLYSISHIQNHSFARIDSGCRIRGYFRCGKKCNIGRNVNIYKHVSIGNNCSLDNNIELRCNGGRKIQIGNQVTINRNTVIGGNVIIKDFCRIGPNCNIFGSNHKFDNPDTPIYQQGMSSVGIVIEEDCWLGANVNVTDGVTIGKGSVVGMGAVVTKSIPPYSIAVGNPCKVIKSRI